MADEGYYSKRGGRGGGRGGRGDHRGGYGDRGGFGGRGRGRGDYTPRGKEEASEKSFTPTPSASLTGGSTKVLVNYFPVKKVQDLKVYRYDVEFLITNEASSIGKETKRDSITKIGEKLKNNLLYGFDGSGQLFTREIVDPIPEFQPTKEQLEKCINFKGNSESLVFAVPLKEKKPPLLVWFRQNGQTVADTQILHICLKWCYVNSGYRIMGNKTFSPKGYFTDDENLFGLNVHQGFVINLQAIATGTALGLELTHIMTFSNISCFDFVRYWMDHLRVRDDNQKFKIINNFLSRLAVKTKWSNRTLKIDYIDFSKTPYNTKADNKTTIAQYFLEKYKLKLAEVPLIKSKNIYLPSDHCMISNWQLPSQKYLSQFDLIKVTRKEPNERYKQILTLANDEMGNYMKALGFEFNKNMMSVDATVLPFPSVETGTKPASVKNFTWNINEADSWKLSNEVGFICYDIHESALGEISGLIGNAAQKLFRKNINFSKKRYEQVRKGENLAAQMIKAVQRLSADVSTIVVLQPEEDEVGYSAAKVGEVFYGIPTQVMVLGKRDTEDIKNGKPCRKTKDSFLFNVLLSTNAKADGINWKTAIDSDCAIFGVDVCHSLDHSTAAVVMMDRATLPKVEGWHVAQQTEAKKEIVSSLGDYVCKLLRDVYIKNKRPLPPNILLLRDGVSQTMFTELYSQEIEGMKKALKNMCQNTPVPKITVLVCQKRHSTRIFTESNKANPVPGTLVDKTVTDDFSSPDPIPNFFLLSHSAFQGTVRPAHYHVLLDEIKWADADLKKFIFALCCLHQGCARPLSYPAPVYFADRLAERGHKCYFSSERNLWTNFSGVKASDLQEISWNTFAKGLARPIMI